ncbi:MAG: tol-pal system protein YbgF [Candidatus Rokubacteria bacterium 13_1_40CM_68_15]|nr:MAG: tol-pal system protein YbgF [Candidatus Rokubacteria bacterium 13_1_40CM_68_15]
MSMPCLAFIALAVLACGCATRGSVRNVRSELAALRNEAALLRQADEQMSRETATALGEIKALEERVKDLTAVANRTTADVGRLNARLGETDESIKRIQAELTAKPVVAAVPPPAERPAREPVRPAQAESAYGAALATFRAREHGQAVLEFLDFIGRYPKHPLAANAQYWIGEAYYSQRDYRQALVEFQKVLEYPAANGKAADALLKMGLCYTNLREPTRANEVWTRVIGEHPSTEAAGHARSFLRNRRALAPGR